MAQQPNSIWTDEWMREEVTARAVDLSLIRAGDRVTIFVYAGRSRSGPEWKQKTGRAVMRGPAGWVLNMGGRFGTPGIAGPDNTVAIKKAKA
jgi:hypothetical protein